MKECPKCHTLYEDNVTFCTKDGTPLQPASTIQNQPQEEPQKQPSQEKSKPAQKKKGKVWKTILITLGVLALVFFAVFNHMRNATSYLRTEPNSITASKAGGDCLIEIDYDGYIWSINHLPNWVEVSEKEQSFMLTVTPNKTGQSREGSITIQSGKQLAQVVIKQNGRATTIQTDQSYLEFDKYGGSKNIEVQTDGCGWSIKCPDWLKVTTNRKGIFVKCYENTDDYRTGAIYLSEDGVEKRISVVQGGLCNVCHGDGDATCGTCSGTGLFFYGGYSMRCPSCGGNGSFRCGTCGGSGRREK